MSLSAGGVNRCLHHWSEGCGGLSVQWRTFTGWRKHPPCAGSCSSPAVKVLTEKGLERLDAFIDRFILARFSTLSFSPDFLQSISLYKLTSYLSSEQVQHDSEQALLQTALQWLSQTPQRAPHTQKLLSLVRFPLMPAGDLVSRILPTMQALLPEEVGCEALVEEAMGYHATVSAQPLLQSGRNALRGGVEGLLLVGGEVSERGQELSANVCRLDEGTGCWEVEAELPAQRRHHSLAVLGGFIFTAGGSSSRDNGGGAACDLLHRYDPPTQAVDPENCSVDGPGC
ncbi:kelch-like protein 36 isoform X5 [Gouania willdenowi]|uniref:kelch-like protein 36 isoform X5 n=1 Tax=Gouania willdenowi TaxID=441366 RepID=UPI0010553345|nr:kelch-like protein 36 isoform X5 [Gouania willdenowi]